METPKSNWIPSVLHLTTVGAPSSQIRRTLQGKEPTQQRRPRLMSWRSSGRWIAYEWDIWYIWMCLKMLCTPKPNGFADLIPFLNGYFIGNIPNIFRQTHVVHSNGRSQWDICLAIFHWDLRGMWIEDLSGKLSWDVPIQDLQWCSGRDFIGAVWGRPRGIHGGFMGDPMGS